MTRQSDRIVRQIEQAIAVVQHRLATEIVRLLQRPPGQGGTPLDTGYASSRWRVTSSGGVELVSNDAPYIMRLNDGSSTQAPAGFIERCIDEAIANVGAIVKSIRVGIAGGESFDYSPAGAA